MSHGVNYGKLKKNTSDERSKFVDKLISYSNNRINFNILGLYNEEPKWNYDFTNELMICKTALNLSRGGPNKYASSNRIASLMGNGVLPFIHSKVKYQDFFDNDEIVIYNDQFSNINDELVKSVHLFTASFVSNGDFVFYEHVLECHHIFFTQIETDFCSYLQNLRFCW